MVEDQVMEEAEGAMEVVVQAMATRVVDLVAAAMEVTEVMMEVKKKITHSRISTVKLKTRCNPEKTCRCTVHLKLRLKIDSYIFRVWRGWKLQRLWKLWWTAVQLWAHEGKQLWWQKLWWTLWR